MKTLKLISLIVIVLFNTKAVAQTYPIYSDLGSNFVQGMSPVVNYYYVDASNIPLSTSYVAFYITAPAPSYAPTYTASYGTYDSGTNTVYWAYDMGLLPASTPSNIVVFAEFLDVNYASIGFSSNDISINLIKSPDWLNTTYQGYLSSVNVNYTNKTVAMLGSLPLSQLISDKSVSSSIIGIGGKTFDVLSPYLDFNLTFDTQTGTTTVSQPTISSNFNALNNSTIPVASTSFTGTLNFDSSFNPTLNATAIWQPQPIVKGYEFNNVPLAGANVGLANIGALCVNTSFQFQLQPKVKAQLYMGYDATAGRWGFKSSGTNITQLLAKVDASATAKGELKAVCGSLLGLSFGVGTIARGQITAALTVGAGIQYKDIPASTTTPLWAGSFELSAYGEIYGLGSKSGTYTPTPWGNTSNFNYKVQNNENDFFTSSTYKVQTPPTPLAWPMGEISTRDSILAAGWLDNKNFGVNTALLASYYNPILNSFSTPVIVAKNDSGIVNHSIALLPNKDILVTWSQLNQLKSNINTSVSTLDDISKMQDIWFAIIDPISNSIIYKGKFTDASNNRADGEPRIHWGSGNQGMITWQVGDDASVNKGSDVYYCVLTENSGSYTITPPQILNNSLGYNYNVSIAYSNGNNAIATWFNDADMDQTTNNTNIMNSIWNGASWTTPVERFSVPSNIILKDYSLSTNGNYGIEGLTYEYFTLDSNIVNGVYLGRWTDGDPYSVTTYSVDQEEDSTYTFQLPKVSVSKNGLASLVIQIRDIYNPNDKGKLNLFMKDLNSSVNWQDVAQTNPTSLGFISDTTDFVWDMSSKYGYLQSSSSSDIMYLFTQEMDNLGNTNPTYGEIFGNPNLNLVLRAFKVNNSGGILTVSDVPEPTTGLVTGFYQELNKFNYDFELKQNYPNPFNYQTTIPFHIYKSGIVKIELYDLTGKYLGVILNKNLTPGDYETLFNSDNLDSGVYFYKISQNESSVMQKMIIAK
jgi:hypothetical protein